jgi:hypothetical protein
MQLSRFRSQMLTVHVITPGIETTLAGSGVGSDTQLTPASFGWRSHWTGVKIKPSRLIPHLEELILWIEEHAVIERASNWLKAIIHFKRGFGNQNGTAFM